MSRSTKGAISATSGRGTEAGLGVAALGAVLYAALFTLYRVLDPAVNPAGLPTGIGSTLLLAFAGWVAATPAAATVGALLRRAPRAGVISGYVVAAATPIALVPTVFATAPQHLWGRILLISALLAALAVAASAAIITRPARPVGEHTLRPGAQLAPGTVPSAGSVGGVPGHAAGPAPFGSSGIGPSGS